ncbi:hypothetical protein FDC58_10730 [Clostridium botulinum]|nr:hypothetical protein [Clostridium botulinum]NFP29713.1 hypothetical protein [Clostridium botulinum]
MKDLVLYLVKYNDHDKIVRLQNYCTEIKLSNSFTQIAAELNFTMPHATLSSTLVKINVELADIVQLYYKDEQIFYGKVIDIGEKGKEETIKVTCYDKSWWLCKSNITKNFSNISIRDALRDVYEEVGAQWDIDKELGSNGDIILNSHLVKDKPVPKVLNAIYNEITKKIGVYYYLHLNEDGIFTITEADKYFSGMTIKMSSSKNSADGNLIDYEVNESMQNMITRVALYNEDGSKAKYGVDEHDEVVNTISLEETDLSRWGIIQEMITMDSEGDLPKAQNEAKRLLQDKSVQTEELSIVCFGDINYKVAHGVMVKIPATKYYDRFMYILSSEWSWNKDGTFISKLSLSPSKHHDLVEFKDIEEKQDEETNLKEGTGSDLVNRILEELKRHLGLPYKWAGKSPNEGGMDCSGYIAYVYNQFSDELEVTSNSHTLTSQTYTMMNEGKDVTKDFPDNLKQCDIVFPHSGHVQAYIGDGKVIHEPQTGDVCKISDLNKNKIAKVIRVVPDNAWNNGVSGGTTSNGYSSKYVELAKDLEGFVSSWDNSSSTGAIGYGTDASGDVGKRLKAQGVTSCTESQATEWLKEELNNWADEVKKRCDNKGIKLNQYCFDCMVDIAYQWGNQKWSILDLLASGDIEGAKAKIKRFGYPRRDNARCNMLDGKYVVND